MRLCIFAIFGVACTVANAQTLRCPAKADGAPLMNAKIMVGASDAAQSVHGDVEQRPGGTTIHYHSSDETPRWLVCQFGGARVEGSAISGADVIGGRESRIALDPLASDCELVIRHAGPQGGNDARWTAALACKRREPPPPDMLSLRWQRAPPVRYHLQPVPVSVSLASGITASNPKPE